MLAKRGTDAYRPGEIHHVHSAAKISGNGEQR